MLPPDEISAKCVQDGRAILSDCERGKDDVGDDAAVLCAVAVDAIELLDRQLERAHFRGIRGPEGLAKIDDLLQPAQDEVRSGKQEPSVRSARRYITNQLEAKAATNPSSTNTTSTTTASTTSTTTTSTP